MERMHCSDNGVNFIKMQEGCRLSAYLCPANRWTIGYGHTGDDVYEGLIINRGDAECFLREDLRIFERCINEVITTELTQNQFDALVSFAYNVGQNALKKSTLVKTVNKDPNSPLLRLEFEKWIFAGSKKIKGLSKRRRDEYTLYARIE